MNLMTIWKNQTPIRKLLKVHMIAGGVPILDYTVTGNPVAFLTNVAKPLGIVAAFSPVQSGSGDPSPDNVRPITGFTGANVWRTGKNLLNYNLIEDLEIAGFTGTRKGVAFTKPGTYYLKSFSAWDTDTYIYAIVKNADGTFGSIQYFIATRNVINKTIAIADGQTLYLFNASSGIYGTTEATIARFDAWEVSVSFDDVSSYAEYTGESVSVTFPATGKNLLNNQAVSDTVNDVVFTVNADKSITAVGEASAALTFELGSMELKAGTYILSGGLSNGAYINIPGKVNAKASETSFTISGETETIAPRIYIAGGENVNGTFYPMIRKSTEQSAAYEPYTNTAYGGTLDLSTGVLTVTHGISNLGDFQYQEYGSTQTLTQYCSKSLDMLAKDNARCISNIFKTTYTKSEWSVRCSRDAWKFYVCTGKDTYESVNALKSALTEAGAVVVYELATPLVYQLTPTEILSLIGNNVLWSDLNGDLTVIYKKKG